MAEMRHLAVLPVTNRFGEARVRRLLPPDHTILAMKPDPTLDLVCYLIEGPWLPICDDQDHPPVVNLCLTMHMLDDFGRVKLTGRWERCPEAIEWPIGEWPSADHYRDDMSKLDVSVH